MVMTLVMVGLGLAILMQLAIFCVAVKNSLVHALLCLFIPCYVYVYARKDRQARPFLWGGTPVLACWPLGLLLQIEAGLEKASATP